MAAKIALVLGATGETGKRVLEQLRINDNVNKIIMVTRRQIDLNEGPGKEKIQQKVVDFDQLDDFRDVFENIDVAFCCLGTTRGKAGKTGFVKVDYDYVVQSAQILQSQQCQDYHLVSSWGANASAWTLYPQTKGKAEEAVKAMDFKRVSIYRPGLLITERSERRTLEGAAQCLAGFLDRGNKASISTEKLAKAMVFNALNKTIQEKHETLEHADILRVVNE